MDSDGDDDQVLVNTALDYTKLDAINQRLQTEHINQFLINTVHFFNTLSAQVENKFQKLEINLQRIDADFAILDSKHTVDQVDMRRMVCFHVFNDAMPIEDMMRGQIFSEITHDLRSTPGYQPLDLADVLTPTTSASTTQQTNISVTTTVPPPPPPVPTGGPPPTEGPPPPPPPPPPPEPEKIEDPRTEKYRKMLAVRVPREAVRHKMVGEGLDQATIESVIGPD
ncbi:unnamed protein product [Rotaria sp. Silwood1]|nr:unnamed protein product [Rotaria sp. Silwood1]CAF1568518.1 unnamed protein product [Rotaria sp. Silwood1]CAF3628014.1 unnamed protein product [Rotaria sp. Silwood1]CAF4699577.1 unnamed protein product [Rotaria sp. Silwood1]CAF4772247.1 unnamed protein product [Rotaria sp. Silwood1]